MWRRHRETGPRARSRLFFRHSIIGAGNGLALSALLLDTGRSVERRERGSDHRRCPGYVASLGGGAPATTTAVLPSGVVQLPLLAEPLCTADAASYGSTVAGAGVFASEAASSP